MAAAAKGWIRHRLAEHGMQVRSIEQRRVRPWSPGLVASTDAGPMYFTASCPAMSFEPAVHAALAEIEPHEVDQPLAIDAGRGCGGCARDRERAAPAGLGGRAEALPAPRCGRRPEVSCQGTTLPGFIVPAGSSAALTARMRSSSVGLFAAATASRLAEPTPCSALMLPSRRRTSS